MKEIDQLKQMDYSKQLAFAYLTCLRLLPNYEYFSTHFNFGDTSTLKDATNCIYDILVANKDTQMKVINHFIGLMYKNAPSTEDFSTIFASSAIDACGAIEETLSFIKDKDVTHLQAISTYAIDTVDMYIQERDDLDYGDPLFENKISEDLLMKREQKIQTDIVSYLKNINKIEEADINTLIELQANSSLNL